MFIIILPFVLSLCAAQTVNFEQGSITYSLPSYQIGASPQLLTLNFNLNITLPQQIYIDFIFPKQNGNQITYRCAISQPNTMCFYQSGMQELRWVNPIQQFQVTFGYFNNPISNYTDPIQVICKNAQNTNTLFNFNFTIQYTLKNLDPIILKANSPITFTETDLQVSWNQSYPLASGAYLRFLFPQFNPGSSKANFGIQANSTIETFDGFSSEFSYQFIGGQLLLLDQYNTTSYGFVIKKFNGLYSVNSLAIIQVAIMDQPNSFISVGQAVIVAEGFYDQIPVKISTTSNYIRDVVNLTITFRPIMMLPSSSILVSYTNKIAFYTDESLVQIGSENVDFSVNINQITDSTTITLSKPQPLIVENQELSIQLINVTNPAYSTLEELFQIIIVDEKNNTSQSGQVVYSSIDQKVKDFSVETSNNVLNTLANYTINIYPRFQIIQGYINLTLPDGLTLTGSLGIYNPQNIYNNFSAYLINSSLVLKNITQIEYDWLQFVIIGILNPQDKIQITPIKLQIGDAQGIMSIDNLATNITYQPFLLNSQLIYDVNSFASSEQNISLILFSSLSWSNTMLIKIFIPQQLGVANAGCLVQSFQCQLNNRTLLISSNNSFKVSNLSVSLTMIQMPSSLSASDSFQIELWSNLLIATGQSDVIQLSQTPQIQLTSTSYSYQLLQNASWNLKINLQNSTINQGDHITIQTPLIGQNVSCFLIGQTTQVIDCQFNNQLQQLVVDSDISFQNSISLQIFGLQNPGSLNGSRNWTIIVTDSLGYKKASGSYQSSNWTITPLARPTITLNDTRLGQESDMIINFENQIYLPVGSQIQIRFLTRSFDTFKIKQVILDENQTHSQSDSQDVFITLKTPLQQGIHSIILSPLSLTKGYKLQGQQILTYKYQINLLRDSQTVQFGTYINQVQYTCNQNCTSCSKSFDQCDSCSENHFLYQNNSCLIGCGEGFALAGNECKKCLTDKKSCAVCSSINQQLCFICAKGYILDNGSCISSLSNQYNISPYREVFNMYFILTGVVMFIVDICILRKCCFKQTRLLTLSYGLLVNVQYVMEMTVIVDFFLRQQSEYAFAALSLLVIHLLSQVYCITQISMTLKTDGDYYNQKRSSGILLVIHFVSNLFSYRTILLLFSRCGKAQYWDGQFHYRIQVMEQLVVLLKISLIYSIGFAGIIVTYVYFNLKLELYFYELAIFNLIMICLDGYHIYWLQKERQITIRKRDVSKLIVSVVDDHRPSPSQVVPRSSNKL